MTRAVQGRSVCFNVMISTSLRIAEWAVDISEYFHADLLCPVEDLKRTDRG